MIATPPGCRRRAQPGDKLSMHYTGTLFSTGAKFDSSLDRTRPFVFTLGVGQVIQGWDPGGEGMYVGERRMLVGQPPLAYGGHGMDRVSHTINTFVYNRKLPNDV